MNTQQFLMNAMQPKNPSKPHRVKPIPKWSPSLSVGNAKLDEQHITLLELGRDLMRLLDTDTATEDQINSALEDIVRLARLHDTLEESILEANDCPTLAEHKGVHRAARTQLDNLLADASRSILDRPVLSGLIADWMGHHISENDLPVKDYMKQTPTARAGA
ncbi:bacteriohemerythrin [Rhodoferax sp.]|uniref:bacteriohemerythrin n=2 Tax=Rhodoferax sp. TaxID=50421 RepID=UPI002726D363|nr:hemerythrin domain-containing protein [Rhodoferax sp.]MDO9145379.1 hemerythrin domain-containing protein [Rhodoferax sp.]MDP1942506.1 hemerythrin domain-containing protein [Rhodoferax sp.]MDP2440359.1 hemerythrin domain-containing protein [Rhodoferax sp.]MDP3193303.1 hemerythrin domain-containing protein [Rhodoferax sp.]MDP3336388.1 hemerythrin domain-containing protein [Rhodoferax sp.]